MTVLSQSARRLRRIAHMARASSQTNSMQLELAARWRDLAALSGPLDISSGQALAPGVTFWLDEDQGQQSLTCQRARGGGVTIRATVETPGRWMGLHFGLGEAALKDLALIGVYSQQRAARACTWRLCLRSGSPDGFIDHFFDHHVVAYNAPAQHVETLMIADQRGLPRQAVWRELVLFFHPESFEATVQDLRLFVA